MTPTSDQVRAAVARQAADWFVANQDGAPGLSERAAFVAWLRSSPLHVEEYLGIALVARELRAATDESNAGLETLLEQARADASDSVVQIPALRQHDPAARRVSRPSRWPVTRFAIAASAVLAALLIWWAGTDSRATYTEVYRTAASEQALRHLPDGSMLHLNAESAAQVEYSPDERVVHLDHGEAFFNVAHEKSRRFRVLAGGAEVVAVGTRFDVRVERGSVTITVADGQVDVFPRVRSGEGDMRRVNAGHRLEIDGGALPAQSERVDVRGEMAWLRHTIAFERQPLGEVADEFNRHGIVRLAIEDADLRALPISGVFNAYDAHSLAAFLETLEGVAVVRTPLEIRVSRSTHVRSDEASR
jgi:transmembrane sensor